MFVNSRFTHCRNLGLALALSAASVSAAEIRIDLAGGPAMGPDNTIPVQITLAGRGLTGQGNPGLGIRLHYDSHQIQYREIAALYQTGAIARPQVQPDTADFDGDSRTDRFVLFGWSVIQGQWPPAGTGMPLPLAEVRFEGLGNEATTLNLTPAALGNGTELHSAPLTLPAGR